jgi:hypothetical protein
VRAVDMAGNVSETRETQVDVARIARRRRF